MLFHKAFRIFQALDTCIPSLHMNKRLDQTAPNDYDEIEPAQDSHAPSMQSLRRIDNLTENNISFIRQKAKEKIIQALDESLQSNDLVTPQALSAYAQKLLDSDKSPCFNGIRAEANIRDIILRTIGAITLLPPLAARLTAAREQRHELYDHSIRMTLFALYLAIKAELPEQGLEIIATAGIFHDLGMLQVDPNLMTQGRRLVSHERQHLYSHPLTAYLMLSTHRAYHPDVSRAVYEHHERLDGSGYPRGLQGDEIGLHSQILMLAEMACTLFSGNKQESAMRLSVMLKLNHQKLNTSLCAPLLQLNKELFGDPHDQNRQAFDLGAIMQAEKLATTIREWRTTFEDCKHQPMSPMQGELLDLINDRFATLIKNLMDAGYDPYTPMATLIQFDNDPQVMLELEFLVREALWQIVDIAHEGLRKSQRGAMAQPDLLKWFENAVDAMD